MGTGSPDLASREAHNLMLTMSQAQPIDAVPSRYGRNDLHSIVAADMRGTMTDVPRARPV
ncbi:hypothetical protein CHELA1G11_12730 [Hyphomicrobiales bacterium]|nr:hypothetical protein CHELA1G2_11577 [Hyphomicrobiales bacterium]CAH1666723.1 hypothetical protein CHELA1G11_12730 [Hyphomicrobiales bacterium]